MYRALPQADVRLILASIIIVLSVLLPLIQYQRWQTAMKYLRVMTVNNYSLKEGGSKQTMELHQRALQTYEAIMPGSGERYASE
jgi:hypothetical protein